ncbi:MFS transporter [Micromonospora sp. WMMD882]|uniref:MFS transporter n=1 Tax=Micromonospora sp. WMMD882 TaxID=3015151 RepID=UPI00248ABB13|nr:MFS transporter [Micromonospora sp. WMMD882]WBB80635.1 MFS transporter [Micromonospora sp. WMMD882]
MRRNAVLFVVISALSGFTGATLILVAGIWALDLTGSAGLAALVGLCVYGPVLAGPWLGDVVDRLPRRPLLVTVNLALSGALLSLLAVRGPAQTWLLFLVCAVYGISLVLRDAGETALLPSALSPTELADVNGWRSSAQEGMKLLAPLVGAGLYAWRGGHAVAALTAAAPTLVSLLYGAVRAVRTPPEQPPSRAARRPADAGHRTTPARLLRGTTAVRATVLLAAVAVAMSGFTTAAVYEVVTTDLALPTTFLGVLVSAQGVGSVLGGLFVGRLVGRLGPVRAGGIGVALFAVGCLVRVLPWPATVVAATVTVGVGLPWALVAAVSAVQTHTPTALLGRVAATANTVMFGPIVVAIPLGSLAAQLGGRPALVLATVICLAAVAVTGPAAGRGPARPATSRGGDGAPVTAG